MSRTVCDVCPPELTYLTPTPARRRYGRVGYFAVQDGNEIFFCPRDGEWDGVDIEKHITRDTSTDWS